MLLQEWKSPLLSLQGDFHGIAHCGPLPCLCEVVWILRHGAKLSKEGLAQSIQDLLDAGNVVINLPAVEAGLAGLKAGGDFADGVIAHERQWLGGETFVSFDQQAVDLIEAQGHAAHVLS
jgi:predicted nucleic-acid-binding protein